VARKQPEPSPLALRIGSRRQGRHAGNAARRKAWPGETQEDGVSEFGDLEKKAKAYAEEHPEQAEKGINEAAGIAERDTDHQHDEQIDRAVDAAQQNIGQGQDQQGTQN
jgi:hypothetical protein